MKVQFNDPADTPPLTVSKFLKTCKVGEAFYIYNDGFERVFYITAESSQGDKTKVFQVMSDRISLPNSLSTFLSCMAIPADVTITFTKK